MPEFKKIRRIEVPLTPEQLEQNEKDRIAKEEFLKKNFKWNDIPASTTENSSIDEEPSLMAPTYRIASDFEGDAMKVFDYIVDNLSGFDIDTGYLKITGNVPVGVSMLTDEIIDPTYAYDSRLTVSHLLSGCILQLFFSDEYDYRRRLDAAIQEVLPANIKYEDKECSLCGTVGKLIRKDIRYQSQLVAVEMNVVDMAVVVLDKTDMGKIARGEKIECGRSNESIKENDLCVTIFLAQIPTVDSLKCSACEDRQQKEMTSAQGV